MSVIWGDDAMEREIIAEANECTMCGEPCDEPPFIWWRLNESEFFHEKCAVDFMLKFAKDIYEAQSGLGGYLHQQNQERAAQAEACHMEGVKAAYPDDPDMWVSEEELYRRAKARRPQ